MDGYLNIKILLNRNEAGRIIGLQGSTIEDIRTNSWASLHLDKDKSKERILKVRGPKGSVMKAVDHILEVFEEGNVRMGKKSIKFIMTDAQCKLLVCSGAIILQQISRETGTKVTVAPLCLPCSEERVVKVEEARGNITECMQHLYDKTLTDSTSTIKAYQPPEERKDSLGDRIKTKQTFPLGKLGTRAEVTTLGRKLGVNMIWGVDEITIEGPIGAVDMFRNLLKMKKMGEQEDTMTDVQDISNEFSLKITAANVSSICNVPKFN